MTSVFLTRRALLSGGAFVGLGALLAACGGSRRLRSTE